MTKIAPAIIQHFNRLAEAGQSFPRVVKTSSEVAWRCLRDLAETLLILAKILGLIIFTVIALPITIPYSIYDKVNKCLDKRPSDAGMFNGFSSKEIPIPPTSELNEPPKVRDSGNILLELNVSRQMPGDFPENGV